MCGHCGCHGVDAIRELKDEHDALLEEVHGVRRALAAGDRGAVVALLDRMAGHLGRHVRREETGVFTAMRDQGEFADEVAALEGEHGELDAALAVLDTSAADFGARALGLLEDLEQHIEREDLGIFPVAVVSLGASGWTAVDRAHAQHTSFLPERIPG